MPKICKAALHVLLQKAQEDSWSALDLWNDLGYWRVIYRLRRLCLLGSLAWVMMDTTECLATTFWLDVCNRYLVSGVYTWYGVPAGSLETSLSLPRRHWLDIYQRVGESVSHVGGCLRCGVRAWRAWGVRLGKCGAVTIAGCWGGIGGRGAAWMRDECGVRAEGSDEWHVHELTPLPQLLQAEAPPWLVATTPPNTSLGGPMNTPSPVQGFLQQHYHCGLVLACKNLKVNRTGHHHYRLFSWKSKNISYLLNMISIFNISNIRTTVSMCPLHYFAFIIIQWATKGRDMYYIHWNFRNSPLLKHFTI